MCIRDSFYPFSRNHNDIRSRDQEPYVFGERVMKATRNAMRQKYSIIMYYYTKLFETSMTGGALFKPLFFDYPEDEKVYERTERIFMIGSSLLVAPVLYPGDTKVRFYLPNEHWYSLKTFSQVRHHQPNSRAGKEIELEDHYDFVNVLVKGGSVVPYQDAHTPKVRKIEDMKDLPSEIVIAPDHEGKASGTWVIDDGISLRTIEDKKYTHVRFNFMMWNKMLAVNMLNSWDSKPTKSEEVSKITIFGAEAWSRVNRLCVYAKDKSTMMMGTYNSEKKTLHFSNPQSQVFWKDVKFVRFNANC
eukprot:TRINITY_DN1212_c0_g7_i1.p1 TRINITY_DN1212_c0_g7~~TRINITY_DN1212_c0_g7_i1.p1  ORF type:complete len:302 (+),score=85.91 TRINITY_DN1212_c0_g7_i1:69-974(+)